MYFQQKGMWRWIVLAMFMCHYGTTNRVIYVDKHLMNCLQELGKGPNSEVTIEKIKLVSTIKQCSNSHHELGKLIKHETNDEIKIVFAGTRIILEINDERIELVQNDAKKIRTLWNGGQRFLGIPSISSIYGKIKTVFHKGGDESEPQPTDQSGYPQEYDQYPPQFEPIPVEAHISGIVVDNVYRFINFVWSTSTDGFKRFILSWIGDSQGCITIPPIWLDQPAFSFMFNHSRICGLADGVLRPLIKTVGPGYWDVSYVMELPDTTMTFGSFQLRTTMLPWPLSNIKLDGVQFHSDRTDLKMSMTVPFELPSIPSNFNFNVERMDNFKVSFLTKYPSLKQRLLAKSLQTSIQFVLNIILKLVATIF